MKTKLLSILLCICLCSSCVLFKPVEEPSDVIEYKTEFDILEENDNYVPWWLDKKD